MKMKNNSLLMVVFSSIILVGCQEQMKQETASSSNDKTIVAHPDTGDAIEVQSADVAAILDDRVNHVERNVGMVAGVLSADGSSVYVEGERIAGSGDNITQDTIFEIGSLTKIFTAVLLSDMVARGEVSFDDPISKYLPSEAHMPNDADDKITLLHLTTHTSGLPRNPPNGTRDGDKGFFAAYTERNLLEFLSGYVPENTPGEKYDYSNVGVGLLGYILASRAGMTYEELLRERIFQPLGMNDTHIKTPAALDVRFAEPHDTSLVQSSRWDFDELGGAGAIRSTVPDMLRFAAAATGIDNSTDIARSIQATYQVKHDVPGGDFSYYIGWIFPDETDRGENIFWHDGGTGGSRSFFGIVNNDDQKLGVVVLSNTAYGVIDIGLHIIDPNYPLRELERIHQISLPAEDLTKFIGRYRLGEDEIITITAEGDQLFAQVTGDGIYPVYPYKDNGFFYKVADAQLIFNMNETGEVISVSLVVGGGEKVAKRI